MRQGFRFRLLGLKGWFSYDRRRSRIANRSQRELFHYNHGRSRTIAEPTFAFTSVSGSVEITGGFVLAEKLHQNMVDVKEEISVQANVLLLFLERRHYQLQNRRKHRFWVRKIFLIYSRPWRRSRLYCHSLATKSSELFQLATLISNLSLMVCNMWIEPFQILKFSWHCISAPIQKVAF